LLLLIPLVSVVLGLLWLDHASNIFAIGDFIKDRIMPQLQAAAEMADLPDYEVFVRERERKPLLNIQTFGIPLASVFIVIPVVSMILAFDKLTKDWGVLAVFAADMVLLLIFVAYWIPFVRGPRPKGSALVSPGTTPGGQRGGAAP
jgi:hypothetical protein